MNITVDRTRFAAAVAFAHRHAGKATSSLAVLSGLLVETDGETVAVSGFDYETSARATIPQLAGEPAKILLPGKFLDDVVRSLPAADTLTLSGDAAVTLACGPVTFTMSTMLAADFPVLPELPAEVGTVDGEAFAHAVAQVEMAAGRDTALPVLGAVRFEPAERLRVVATDRYRLAVRDLDWKPAETDDPAPFLVAAPTVAGVAKNATGPVAIHHGADRHGASLAGFSSAGMAVTTRLIEGQYVPYAKLIPADGAPALVVDVEVADLIDAAKRSALATKPGEPIRLVFSPGSVAVSASGSERGHAESVPAGGGDTFSAAFNPAYLQDALRSLDSGTVRFRFNPDSPGSKPAVLTGLAGDELIPGYVHLLMPIRPAS